MSKKLATLRELLEPEPDDQQSLGERTQRIDLTRQLAALRCVNADGPVPSRFRRSWLGTPHADLGYSPGTSREE